VEQTGTHDRFIPNRAAMQMEKAHYALSKENSNPLEDDAGTGADQTTHGDTNAKASASASSGGIKKGKEQSPV